MYTDFESKLTSLLDGCVDVTTKTLIENMLETFHMKIQNQQKEKELLEYKHKNQMLKYMESCDAVLMKKGGNGKLALDNETRVVDEFNNNRIYKEELLQKCGLGDFDDWCAVKVNKENDCHVCQTESWKKSKANSNEKSPTSKSDIALVNNKTNTKIGVSLKSGEGRATSADSNETKAIFENVLNSNNNFVGNQELSELVNKLTTSFLSRKLTNSKLKKRDMDKLYVSNIDDFKTNYNEEYLWYNELMESCKTCNEIWKIICEKYGDFKIALIKECLSGKCKFGSNIGNANFLVKLKDSTNTSIVDIYNLNTNDENYINYCKKIGNGNVFACKSSKTTLWMRFL